VMVRSWSNWSGYSFHIPKWLHLMNDHSIEPYKIEWSSSEWLDLIDQILWSDSTCRSSQVLVHCCLQLQHLLGLQTSFELGYMEYVVHT
jgi:hypothetical protein